jgi:8-oxo-dGTP pyrophosphatase MutT (NUDIX family)
MSVKEKHFSKKINFQVAALCFKLSDRNKIDVLLITSRRSKRWVIPKGWPIKGLKAYKAAEQEALEEAGAIGNILDFCVGKYSYLKELDNKYITCEVAVYPLNVIELTEDYKERKERDRTWVSLKVAVNNVFEPELKQILRNFDPKLLLNSKFLK